MRIIAMVLAVAGHVGAAVAHPSVVPHQHPHASSMLPDALALVFAALLVGLGFLALRRTGKE